MRIRELWSQEDWRLRILTDDGRSGTFDVKPYLSLPAFEPLLDKAEFARLKSGGYYVEWACGADLSADTIEARMEPDPP